MEQVKGVPPMFEQIAAVLPAARGPNVVFSWGDRVYVPSGAALSPFILDHERVHGARQLAHAGGVEGWWTKYLETDWFRLEEEVAGHAAEYRSLCQGVADRNARSRYLTGVATKLASPLYGGLVTLAEARKMVSTGRV